jgi:hypothetical protein
LSDDKKQQVIALGRLGWSLRRIEAAVHIRRETVAGYLRAMGIPVRPPGGWGKLDPAKPANEVITDFGAELPPLTIVERKPIPHSSASISANYREAIELGLSHGRNAMAIWQELVDNQGFTASYQSVQRFVRKLQIAISPEARVVIETAPGEDYGESGVMVRSGAAPSLLAGNLRRSWFVRYIMHYRASSHSMRLEDKCGVGACVGCGPFAESRALRFISRSA